MKQLKILMAAAALATLVAGAPAAWAGETSPPAVVGLPGLEQAAQAVMPTSSASPASLAHECADQIEARLVADTAATCNFGVPPCAYAGQCTTWCSPYGTGLCLSGCCACKF